MEEYGSLNKLWETERNGAGIEVGSECYVNGFRYTKVEPLHDEMEWLYENDASYIIKLIATTPFIEFKKGIRKVAARNQFGQILK